MLKATATWKNGATRTGYFFRESERIVWIAETKEFCKIRNLALPEITLGDDLEEPRKKLWGRIGLEADITEVEFDILQSGGAKAEALVHHLLEQRRFRPSGETYFPEASGDDVHEIGNEICLDI